jgi:hypothetical protein
MDPLGLAMENFDAVGAWRTEDNGEHVDASDNWRTAQTSMESSAARLRF